MELGRLLPIEVAVWIGIEVCAGLDFAHESVAIDGTWYLKAVLKLPVSVKLTSALPPRRGLVTPMPPRPCRPRRR